MVEFEDSPKYMLRRKHIYDIPRQKFSHGGFGVALVGRYLYAVRKFGKEIYEFDRKDKKREIRRLKIQKITNPTDMLAVDSKLFVTDCDANNPGIFSISKEERSFGNVGMSEKDIDPQKITFSKLSDRPLIPFALALSTPKDNGDRQLIVTLHYSPESGTEFEQEKFVIFCNLDGDNARLLKLPSFIYESMHFVEDPKTDGYVLLHRSPENHHSSTSVDTRAIYKMYHGNGNMVPNESHNDCYNSKIDEELDSAHVAVLKDGNFVALGWKMDKILFISNDLKHYHDMAEKRMVRPCRIAYIPEIDRIFVVFINEVVEYKIHSKSHIVLKSRVKRPQTADPEQSVSNPLISRKEVELNTTRNSDSNDNNDLGEGTTKKTMF